METRFIDGGEFVDKATYIETRYKLGSAIDRIAKLEAKLKIWKLDTSSLGHACPACGRAYDLALQGNHK